MSWELVALLSVIAVCSTIVHAINAKKNPDYDERLNALDRELSSFRSDCEQLAKTNHETKKLLSEIQLAKGLRVTR